MLMFGFFDIKLHYDRLQLIASKLEGHVPLIFSKKVVLKKAIGPLVFVGKIIEQRVPSPHEIKTSKIHDVFYLSNPKWIEKGKQKLILKGHESFRTHFKLR